MNSDEYNNAIKGVISDLESGQHANIMIQIANTALSMIHSRITETGMDSKGGRYRDYSEWYKKYKTEKGKYRGFVDFSFTTRMWTNIQIIKERCTETLAVITARDKGTLGSRTMIPIKAHKRKGKDVPASQRSVYDPSNYEKLEKNTERFGPILDLTKEEIQILKQQYDSLLLDIYTKHGLR